ncbi:hypothetical protein ND00_15870 [Clostridium sp. L74]|nr:hypothetical protein ND00_15870 [Clostridium sp. L74]
MNHLIKEYAIYSDKYFRYDIIGKYKKYITKYNNHMKF